MSNISIIGAGPGGLAAGLMLLYQGHEVHIYEKDNRVGGRSKRLTFGDFVFDSGPTFFMHQPILREVFERSGLSFDEHIKLRKLDPLYGLYFNDFKIEPSANPNDTAEMFEKISKGAGKAYLTWYKKQHIKFKKVMPILQKPFPNVFHFLRPDVLAGAPVLHPFQSVYNRLSRFFDHEDLIHTLSFQAKYLGMASFEAPSVFTILPFLEHYGGLYHVEGGLNQINEKMAELFVSLGGHLHLNTEVKHIHVKEKHIEWIETNQGQIQIDQVVLNADFADAMLRMVDPHALKRFSHEKLKHMKYSVSALMVYVGLDQVFDFKHHSVLFSKDYKRYLNKLMNNTASLEDMSFYMHNPSLIDQTLAPKGKSALYLLMPVPNNDAGIDWEAEKEQMFEQMIQTIHEKTGIDIKPHVIQKNFLTPNDWEKDYHVYKGAVFNLAHGFDQMLHKRPQNNFKDIKNLYLVGGGTHPGSGLPTIYQSAIITANYLKKV
ncbi:MAG: phytoene desaturase family protein [Acholeplasmataceae bacterium]